MKKITSFYYKLEKTSDYIFIILCSISATMCLFGLFYETPAKAMTGLCEIIKSSDALITDYLDVGGVGASFLNAGLVMGLSVLLQKWVKLPFSGIGIACTFLMFGFALFGKNIVNILPIILGGWLYSKAQHQHFARVIYAVLFGTCLAPVPTEIARMLHLNLLQTICATLVIGVFIGFIIAPFGAFTIRMHMGYSLYNIGFAGGLITFIVTSLMRSYGFEFTSNTQWSTKYTFPLSILLSILFLVLIGLGFWWNGKTFYGTKKIMRHSGRVLADFTTLDGLPKTLINMGVLGFMAMGYVLLIGAPLNGPSVGGILTVVGFGAAGKHPKNITPVVLGVVAASYVMHWDLRDPAMVLAALFSTGLAPIAGQFGAFWGVVVGFAHSAVARDVSMLHGWLNLYNNGFAAGFVCMVFVPLIEALDLSEDDEARHWVIVTPLMQKIKKIIRAMFQQKEK